MNFLYLRGVSQDKIHEQHKRFRMGLPVDRQIIRDDIFRSWERCRAYGLPEDGRPECVLGKTGLEQELARHARLIELAEPVLNTFLPFIQDTDCNLCIASAEGVILKSFMLGRMSFIPGYIDTEYNSGTSAISLCVEEKKDVEVFGAEHYLSSGFPFAGYASPIFGLHGRLMGIIALMSLSNDYRPYAKCMLNSISRTIGAHANLRACAENSRLIMDFMSDAVFRLNEEGILLVYNRQFSSLLQTSRNMVGLPLDEFMEFGEPLVAMLKKRPGYAEKDCQVRLKTRHAKLSCKVTVMKNVDTCELTVFLRPADATPSGVGLAEGPSKAVYTFDDILCCDEAMQSVVERAQLAASSDIAVFIHGESGVGKELFAHAIHNASRRRAKPFVVVNCGGLQRELVLSEFFGYSEGAFTGARRLGKSGKLEIADGGTVFLDEIGEMPTEAQTGLLRFLQSGEVARIGENTLRNVNVRIIAATNRNLEDAIKRRQFRADLYYRLNAFPLLVPSLRERGSNDVGALAETFLERCEKDGVRKRFSDEALAVILTYDWPGNVRELQNAVEFAAHIAKSEVIMPCDFPQGGLGGTSVRPERVVSSASEPSVSGGRVERASILHALEQHAGQMAGAAAALGMPLRTLYYKVRKLGIDPKELRWKSVSAGEGACERDMEQLLSALRTLNDADWSRLMDSVQALRSD